VRSLEPVAPVATAKSGRTFGDVLSESLDYGRTAQGREWAPRTADDNGKQVASRIRPTLGSHRLVDLRAADLENVYPSWSADGLSDNTVQRWSYCHREARLTRGPARLARANRMQCKRAIRKGRSFHVLRRAVPNYT
jgi:hypothetical protein